ncbi:MAG: hypothetical protein VKL59_08110 [Nostocaceae cyanobacterium]|nr:hypothetical protein [Nostocaceae cyanobacterium]
MHRNLLDGGEAIALVETTASDRFVFDCLLFAEFFLLVDVNSHKLCTAFRSTPLSRVILESA